jgi:uncharacterized SAM-binding protein YcdF (DUF218 family)
MFFLSKLIPVFLFPLGLAILVLAASCILLFRRRAEAAFLIVLCIAGLWLASTQAVSSALLSPLEFRGEQRAAQGPPRAGAIVVLGGDVAMKWPPGAGVRPGRSFGRLYRALRLYREGKADLLVFSGGVMPWMEESGYPPESELMWVLAHQWGIGSEHVVLETESRNTHENALYTGQLLQERNISKVLLVTSARHMPRALACFREQGMQPFPAPADYLTEPRASSTMLDYLPDARHLYYTTLALKEYMGIVYYYLRGWV